MQKGGCQVRGEGALVLDGDGCFGFFTAPVVNEGGGYGLAVVEVVPGCVSGI